MVQKISIFMILMQCIVALPTAGAGVGHTTNNGGGLGEIEFRGVWQTLEQILAPCLNHPQIICGISPGQVAVLRNSIKNRPQSPAKIQAHDVENADGSPLERQALLTLALKTALECEGVLGGIDPARLAKQALNFSYYRNLNDGRAVALTASDHRLIMITPSGSRTLNNDLEAKLKTPPGFELNILDVNAFNSPNGVSIEVSAMMDPATRVHFEFTIRDEKSSLMVYP
jgi:hypothetical protein